MQHLSLQEIEQLVSGFNDCTLPSKEWTHEAHLITACWFLHHYSLNEAICLIRSGIICYNTSQGGKNTPDSGYHETITLFYMKLMDRIFNPSSASLETKVNWILENKIGAKKFPLTFYSKEKLMSTEARAQWIEPDLRSLESFNHDFSTFNQ